MPNNVGYTPGSGAIIAAEEISGVLHQRVKIGVGENGVAVDVSSTNPMPISGTVTANTGLSQPLTDAQLRATAVPVSGTVTANTGLLQAVTDAQLRATPVPVSGTFFQATQPVSIASSVPVTGPVTDAQLRATPVPVSGIVTANTGLTQPLTDAQLRATAVPVSIGSIDLPTGASTLAEQQSQTTILGTIDADTASISTSASSIDGKTPTLVSGRVPVDGSGVTQPVSGTFWQATQPVSAASLPLPSGAATSANQPDVRTDNPLYNDRGAVVRQAPADIWAVGFADTAASLVASEFIQRRLGTGVGVTQGSSNLLVTTGTTTNQEFLARSSVSFRGAFIERHKTILSQRIANNNFAVLMADRIGEDLACTVNSATSITVTKVAHGFTSNNVGQFMFVGAINGVAGVPGRYAIASIPSVDTINFTVAGWPASGSCTVDLFGWNYIWTQYTGTTATQANVDAQRRGWNSGNTVATINTTASPGHVMQSTIDGRNVNWADTLVASATTPNVTTRASRVESLPDDDVELFFYIWSWNGTTAPATTTTWTIGFVSVEDIANVPTYLAGIRPQGSSAPLSVIFPSAQAVTPTALVAGTGLIGDVGQQYRANATGAASGAHLIAAGTTNATIVKGSAGRVLGWALANTNAAWRYVKLHNIATLPTAGAGVVRTIAIPPNSLAQMKLEGGIAFSTGIGLTTVTGSADADATAVTAGDIIGELFFA